MTETCRGCGAKLQDTDKDAVGYAPDITKGLCQRCFRISNYGDLTIDMKRGIDSIDTLDKIAALDAVVFWVADLFALEANLISRLNRKLPGKDIVLVLTKRDVLPATLSDEKIRAFVQQRLEEEGIEVKDILITGGFLQNGTAAKESTEQIRRAMEKYRKGKDVVFMGMANAGKSTLLNRLTRGGLTISRNPGTTLDLIPLPADGYIIYDTPGVENHHSVLTMLDAKDLKTVIPTKALRPVVSQIREDQSFAAGGLARLDVKTDGKASVVANFSRDVPIHRGKLENADRLWQAHLGGMLAPALDESLDTMMTYTAPRLLPGEKMDVDIAGLGWFCVSGDVKDMQVKVHKGVDVTFRKAMI